MKVRTKSLRKPYAVLMATVVAGSLVVMAPFATTQSASALTDVSKLYVDKTIEEYEKEFIALNQEVVTEGTTLLQNKNALPLAKSEKISVLGVGSFHSNLNGTSKNQPGETTISDALKEEGFSVNPDTAAIYANATTKSISGISTLIDPGSSVLSDSVIGTYNDVAVITITRAGAEGHDLATSQDEMLDDNDEAIVEAAHQLALFPGELELIKYAKDKFDKVVVLLNTPTVMQIPELVKDGGEYEVDALLFVGFPGQFGFTGVAEVLSGKVNPSGHASDIWYSDFTKDPTYKNVANRIGMVNGTYSVEYEEGIYLGYKYYETADAEAKHSNYDGFNYDTAVVFPFGYGLSYTTFEQKILTTAAEIQDALAAVTSFDDYIDIKVEVTNTGATAGKDVVQLYVHAPYTKGEIEKSEVVLVGFGKTGTLEADGSETVTISVRVAELCSFDWNDANGNNWFGYELERGDYTLSARQNSHEVYTYNYGAANAEVGFNLNTSLKFANTGEVTEKTNTVKDTVFSNGNDFDTLALVSADNILDTSDTEAFKIMSRSDFEGTFPTSPSTMGLSADTNKYKSGVPTRYSDAFTPADDLETDPWYVKSEDIPGDWTQGANTDYKLADMTLIDYTSDEVITSGVWEGKTGAQAWTIFMNQLSWDDVKAVVSSGSEMTPAIASIGKPRQTDANGPEGVSNEGTKWACANIMASTWNDELLEECGAAMGTEAMFYGYQGWYAPTGNINRSPFGGRNWQYFSDDALLTGKISSALIRGAQSRGLASYVKHFALNDQETQRRNISTWVTEQALRETYLKAYEICVKEGETLGVMMSLNRVGGVNAVGNYALDQQLLRDEWGFKGVTITDSYEESMVKANMMQRVGGDFPLGMYVAKISGDWDASKNGGKGMVVYNGVESPTQWSAIRTSAMRLLYMAANTNQVYNGYDIAAFTLQEIPGVVNNKLPVYIGEETTINVGVSKEVLGTDQVEYSATGLPDGMTIDSKTGVISGIPTKEQNARPTVTLHITAEGEEWISATLTFNISVEEAPAGGLTAGAIAGIVIGCAALVAAAVVVTLLLLKKKKATAGNAPEPAQAKAEPVKEEKTQKPDGGNDAEK